jgi:hypothetical protein
MRDDMIRLQWTGETGPAGARVVFIQRAEQRLAGGHIHVNAIVFVVPIFVTKGRFGAFMLCDLILHGRQELLKLGVRGLGIAFHANLLHV